MVKYRVIRALLKAVTLRLSVFEAGKAPISVPDGFLTFSGVPEDLFVLEGLVKAYQQVFFEPPWEEEWSVERVLAKLQRELTGDSFLVLMRGDESWPVAGFSWGAILSVEALEIRVGTALGMESVGLKQELHARGVSQILYFDEFAILRQFRSGLDPLRFLMRPGFELGQNHSVFQTLFWSTPSSKIVPLATYMGYEPIFLLKVEEKEIVFLYNANFFPFLKILQNMESLRVARFMAGAARILGFKRKRAGT